jgi:hypothetical protein
MEIQECALYKKKYSIRIISSILTNLMHMAWYISNHEFAGTTPRKQKLVVE